ncbi:MAG: regulatory protein RecX [Oscillospiraceae bacterium]
MKITDIQKANGSRYTIFIDDEYWYILDGEIILANNLRVGAEVSQQQLDDYKQQAQVRKARERAFYLISYRDHSQKEMFNKLKKSVDEKVAAQTVAMLVKQGLIDDTAYAQKLSDYYLITKKWGKRKAMYEMLNKGIDKELISASLDECEVDTSANIIEIIEQKYYDKLTDYNDRQKVIAALMRRGYVYSQIKTAIDEYAQQDTDYE